MWFRSAGSAAHDDGHARADLEAFATDGSVHVIDVDGDDVIRAATTAFLDDSGELVGRTFHDLSAVVADRFGNMNHYEVMSTSDDRVDSEGRVRYHRGPDHQCRNPRFRRLGRSGTHSDRLPSRQADAGP